VSDLAGALLRYRVMAFVVGVVLLVLVFIGLPLQYAVGGVWQKVVPDAFTVHGLLYIVYLVTAVDLARRCRFTLLQLAAMVCAGFLPFLAFFVEHRVNLRVTAVLAGEEPARPGDPTQADRSDTEQRETGRRA